MWEISWCCMSLLSKFEWPRIRKDESIILLPYYICQIICMSCCFQNLNDLEKGKMKASFCYHIVFARLFVNSPFPFGFWVVILMLSLFPLIFTGDQGFLNSYYAAFANAHLFKPNMAPELMKSRPVPDMERLSTLYNADVGLYMLVNKASVWLKHFLFSFLIFEEVTEML